MKNSIKTVAFAVVAAMAVSVTSCESFEQTNTNPNTFSKDNIVPMYLASPAMIRSTMGADMWQRIINLNTDTYAQYFCNDKYSTNTCVPDNSWNTDYWNSAWTWIVNLKEAIAICGDDPLLNNQKQMCRIWKTWVYSRFTDYFGDLPYSQALNLAEYPNPKYDSQKDIYYDLIKEVSEASAAIDFTIPNTIAAYDPFFGGDMAKWQQLANTLHLRYAMRMAYADPAKAKAEAEAAAAAPGGFLKEDVKIWKGVSAYTTNVGHNLFYPWPHYWPTRLTLSTSMEKILTNLGGVAVEKKDYYQEGKVPAFADPRALIMFNVTSDGTLAGFQRHREKDPETGKTIWVIDYDFRGQWQGVQPGLTMSEGNKVENMGTNNPRLGAFFLGNNTEAPVDKEPDLNKDGYQPLMYGSESQFLLAEAALRGYSVGGDAKSFYEAGIRMDMARYGNLIKSADIDSYINSDMKNKMGTSVAFNDCAGTDLSGDRNSKLMKIMTQKYIANFPANSYEAWTDYRRTGMPALDPFESPQPGFVIEAKGMDYLGSVRRSTYPADEKTLNPEQYQIVVDAMGGDGTTQRMWWDCRTEVVK